MSTRLIKDKKTLSHNLGTLIMKITKSKLAQIVQEELQAVTAEGYKAYKRDDKNPKGLSPQYRFTDAASTDDTEERFHKSEHSPYSDKKPKRGLEEAGEDTDTLESHMLGREHALAVSKGEMAKEDTYLKRLRDEAYGAGFDDAMKKLDPRFNWDDEGGGDGDDSLNPDEPEGWDDHEMWENKITKSQLAQIVQEELKATLSEAYSDTEYDDSADEQAYAYARDEALRSAIDDSLEDWAGTPAPIHEIIPGAPEGVNQIGWDEAGEEYLFDLVKAGDVVRVEGSPNDDWYGKEANLYVLAQ
jgi:hypothetical protein